MNEAETDEACFGAASEPRRRESDAFSDACNALLSCLYFQWVEALILICGAYMREVCGGRVVVSWKSTRSGWLQFWEKMDENEKLLAALVKCGRIPLWA